MSAPLKATSRRIRTKAEILAENEELIAENERVAGLIEGVRWELDWNQKNLRLANDTLYEVWVELNDGHTEAAKQILDKYFLDEDEEYDFYDGGDDNALQPTTTPADSGGIPQNA